MAVVAAGFDGMTVRTAGTFGAATAIDGLVAGATGAMVAAVEATIVGGGVAFVVTAEGACLVVRTSALADAWLSDPVPSLSNESLYSGATARAGAGAGAWEV